MSFGVLCAAETGNALRPRMAGGTDSTPKAALLDTVNQVSVPDALVDVNLLHIRSIFFDHSSFQKKATRPPTNCLP